MRDDRYREFLDLLRSNEIQSVEKGQSLGRFHERYGSTRAGAKLNAGRAASGRDKGYDVAFKFFTHAHVLHGALEAKHVQQGSARFQIVQGMGVFLRGED